MKKILSEEFKEEINDLICDISDEEDIKDWLSEHDTALEDCLSYFNVDDIQEVSFEDLVDWIYNHEELSQDFERYFNYKLNDDDELEMVLDLDDDLEEINDDTFKLPSDKDIDNIPDDTISDWF